MLQCWADGFVEVGLGVDVVGYRVAVDASAVSWPAGLPDHKADLVGATGDLLDVTECPEGLVEEICCRIAKVLV